MQKSGTSFSRCRLGYPCLVFDIELLLKAINTPACVYQLLLAGKEGVAIAADFNMDIFFGGTRFNLCAAGTFDCCSLILGMDAFFHYFSPRIS